MVGLNPYIGQPSKRYSYMHSKINMSKTTLAHMKHLKLAMHTGEESSFESGQPGFKLQLYQ